MVVVVVVVVVAVAHVNFEFDLRGLKIVAHKLIRLTDCSEQLTWKGNTMLFFVR